VIALYRYLLISVLLSQRYLPPVLVFLVALFTGTSADSGPLLHAYSFCVLAVVACSTWLAVAVVNHENAIQRQVVIVTAGSAQRVLAVTVAVALTGCLFMIAVGLVYPTVTGRHVVTAGAVAAGAAAQLAAALIGISLGLLTSRLVIPRVGVAVLTAVLVLVVLLVVRDASPVGPLIRLLDRASSPASIAGRLAGLTAISAAVLAASAIATHLIARRRE
jgi:hypothetical protein